MSPPTIVQIDGINKKILKILTQDARTSLKDIAKECNVSAVSVMNRIKRLKKEGVITGATLFPILVPLGFTIVATIGMEIDSEVYEVLRYLKDHFYLIEPSISIGEYDLMAVVYAENMTVLNKRVEDIRRRFGVRRVTVNVWSGIPYLNYGNVDLNPLEKE